VVGRSNRPADAAAARNVAAVTDLMAVLLDDLGDGAEPAGRALELLRRQLNAGHAAVWSFSDGRARRALCAGDATGPGEIADPGDVTLIVNRLHRTRTIRCRPGEVAGVEPLLPEGSRSFIAAAAAHRGVVHGALVLNWEADALPYGPDAGPPLRIAAELLTRAVTAPLLRPSGQTTLAEAMLQSSTDAVIAIDCDGTILAVNRAWGELNRHGTAHFPGPGANYLDACRRYVDANDSAQAAEALRGIEDVCRGVSDYFEMIYSSEPTAERHYRMTVTRLQRPAGGALVAHVEITPDRVGNLSRVLGLKLFQELADTVPVPIWIVASDGALRYGNAPWTHATGGGDATDAGAGAIHWMNAVHPDDRDLLATAFRTAVARRDHLGVEARLRCADGGYRWWAFSGAPRFTPSGDLEEYIGACSDATAKRHARQELHEVGTKLVAAQEAERSRIARELHDDLGQQLALLAAQLETMAHPWAKASRFEGHERRAFAPSVQASLGQVRRTLQELAVSVHNMSHELHPARLKLLGLTLTLESLCRDVAHESGVQIHVTCAPIPSDVDESSALCVFRVTQEALQNVVKHSGAREVDVDLSATPSHLELRIIDRGRGFDPVTSESMGIGLLTMRERVELIGGHLRIETAPKRGTQIQAVVPIRSAAAAAS
jgi:PAS domain S-box-containing protein